MMRLPHAADLPLPAYHSDLAAGIDLIAAVPADAPISIAPGARALIPTGIALALPAGVEGQVRPRSGLALTRGVTVLNSPGTIDADYRGEVQVILVNAGSDVFVVERGARIAQLVFAATLRAIVSEVARLSETTRAARGFGSTGSGRQAQTVSSRPSLPGVTLQVGFTRLAALCGADLGHGRGPMQSIALAVKGLFRWVRGSSPRMTD
jgi:dUTP pyrophosphatase